MTDYASENGDIEAEFVTETYAVVDSAGNVVFQFEGRILAEGIDLPAHDVLSSDPLPHSVIQWLSEADGELVARLYAQENDATDRRQLILEAFKDSNDYAKILLDHFPGGQTGIYAQLDEGGASFQSVRILGEDGESGFCRLEGMGLVRMTFRIVNYDPPNIVAGGVSVEDIPLGADSLEIGDEFICNGITGLANGLVLQRAHGVALAADTARIYLQNTTGAGINSPAGDYHFVCFHTAA